MKYISIDPVINEWVNKHSLVIYKNYQEFEVRSVDLVDIKGNRYQIWIDPPLDEKVSIHAWDYKKRKKDWYIEIKELNNYLENALNTVKKWFE